MVTEVTFIPGQNVNAVINLPASKSISNRVLIIHAIGDLNSEISNISNAEDTKTLQKLLADENEQVDAGEGGTTLRFLLAYYALRGVTKTISASESLTRRPVADLIEALNTIGANITYSGEQGKLPVIIKPSAMHGGTVSISGELSSQFISALMMIGPYLSGGLKIELTGEVLSLPYILMTKSVMEYFGAEVTFNKNIVHIAPGKYSNLDIEIETDWSAASYWYEITAISSGFEVLLTGLKKESLQGDSVVADIMKKLGVVTTFDDQGAKLSKQNNFSPPEYFKTDFTGCPDLGPAVAATCGALNITADLTGLKNFRLKESDRAVAMQRELYNMNVKTDFCDGSKVKIYAGNGMRAWNRPVNTYNDHRIAMAIAPLVIKTGKVLIENPDVVKKSYPHFFEDLKRAGFEVKNME